MCKFWFPDLQQLYFTEGDLIRKRFWFFISVRRCTSAGGHYTDGIGSAINGFRLLLRSLLKQANCCLQPENLLLDSSGNLKISDFGLSALPQQVRVRLLPHFFVSVPWLHLLCCMKLIAWKYLVGSSAHITNSLWKKSVQLLSFEQEYITNL